MKIKIEKENSDEKQEIKLVVKGDISGDGKTTITDLSEVNHMVLEIGELKDEFKMAADIDEINKITITDLSEINHMILYEESN